MENEPAPVQTGRRTAGKDLRVKDAREILIVIGPLPPPSMGPAIATRSIIQSRLFQDRFTVVHLDITDRQGHRDIGRWSIGNIYLAIRHGVQAFSTVLKHPRAVMYISIARGLLGLLRDALLVIPSLLAGAPFVVHLRCGEFRVYNESGPFVRFLMRQVFGRAARALYLGENLKQMTGDLFPDDRKLVAHNGVNLEFYRRRRLPAEREEIRFCCVANLYRDKGTHVILRAVRFLKERGLKFHMTFAGWWHDDRFRAECFALVRDHALEELVTFHEPVMLEKKRELLYEQDVTVFCPVEQEGMPWTVLEGMASVMPVIATPQGTIPELVRDGHNGFLVPAEDAGALAARMETFIGNPSLIEVMGEKSRGMIEEKFNENSSLSLLRDIIAEVSAEHYGGISAS